ncbi:MAG TPA: hypothetical protein VGN63_03675 [Flavisolibacter sp.]|nr:hypothetical protein [Flavisolibacter sp.]
MKRKDPSAACAAEASIGMTSTMRDNNSHSAIRKAREKLLNCHGEEGAICGLHW